MAVYNETGKHRKQIRIDSSSLSDIQCKAIVGFHAFSGNDYISSFLRKTKKMWDKIKNDEDTLKFMSNLGVATLED